MNGLEGAGGPFGVGWGRLDGVESLFQIVANSAIDAMFDFCPNLV
jgi:Leu/Phe-tRNA-protein transferase